MRLKKYLKTPLKIDDYQKVSFVCGFGLGQIYSSMQAIKMDLVGCKKKKGMGTHVNLREDRARSGK